MYNICKIHVQYCFVQYTVHILQNEIFYEMTYMSGAHISIRRAPGETSRKLVNE